MVRLAVIILLALLLAVAVPISGILPQGVAFASPDEVTYYFNAYAEGVEEWTTTPQFAVDNVLTNYASTTIENQVERLTGNTCLGTDLGTIVKVELRASAYGDGNDELYIRPEFTGGAGDNHITVPTGEGAWGAYQDITNDTNAPDWSLWSHVQDLECDIELDDTAKGGVMHCAKVEIRVTYWAPPVADIDVGAIPIDRISETVLTSYTYIDKNNPANASGALTAIKVWANTNLADFVVGTFYTTNGNTLKCRDSEAIGAVEAGAERTFIELSITVVEGDYIGCYFTGGSLEVGTSGFAGVWYVSGEYIDPNDETTYTLQADYALSLYGYGDIEVPTPPAPPPTPSEILPEEVPPTVGIEHLAWLIPMVLFSVLAFWMCNGLLFMLAGGSSLMMGFSWYDIFTTNLGLSIGILLVAYALVCLGFALQCMFWRGKVREE